MNEKEARYANAVIGVCLFISAFVWPHSSAQFTNTWIMGVIVTAVALIATRVPGFQFVNTLAGIWLVISAFVLPAVRVGTMWNNAIVGIAVVGLSLVGAGMAFKGKGTPLGRRPLGSTA